MQGDDLGLVPVAWRYRVFLHELTGEPTWSNWGLSKGPDNPGPSIGGRFEAEPLYDAAAIERLVAEVARLKIESSKHAYEADKAREDRDHAERRSEAFWSKQTKATEAQRDKLKEALDRLSRDATQIMSAHDPRGAELGMTGDEANRRVNSFVADAAPFINGIPARARQALKDAP